MLRPHRILSTTAAVAGVWSTLHARSASVVNWRQPILGGRRWGALHARCGGDGDTAILLLHGLVSTGDVFGAAFDALAADHRVLVPDLLGFGRSVDEARSSFPVEHHLDALDQLAGRTGVLSARRVIVGAHSMGAALALRWARRHPALVDRVVCWGAPIYPSPAAARAHISGSTMARLFVLDTRWAQRACALSCRHRNAAGLLTAAVEPRLPIPIARAVPLHTWPAYRDAMQHLVIDTDWAALLHGPLGENNTPTDLTWGDRDAVGDRTYARKALSSPTEVRVTTVRGADHRLPMTHAELCASQLTAHRRRS